MRALPLVRSHVAAARRRWADPERARARSAAPHDAHAVVGAAPRAQPAWETESPRRWESNAAPPRRRCGTSIRVARSEPGQPHPRTQRTHRVQSGACVRLRQRSSKAAVGPAAKCAGNVAASSVAAALPPTGVPVPPASPMPPVRREPCARRAPRSWARQLLQRKRGARHGTSPPARVDTALGATAAPAPPPTPAHPRRCTCAAR